MKTGDIFEITYPFIKVKFTSYDEEGSTTVDSWQPGVRHEQFDEDDFAAFADKEGLMILEIISIHKPGKYPERIFYTRKWKDPNGNLFGKNGLKICAIQKFNRLIRGYYYNYEIRVETN